MVLQVSTITSEFLGDSFRGNQPQLIIDLQRVKPVAHTSSFLKDSENFFPKFHILLAKKVAKKISKKSQPNCYICF